ncbi:hypothetical protein L916_14470, partial [Phytophthora nicotianae]
RAHVGTRCPVHHPVMERQSSDAGKATFSKFGVDALPSLHLVPTRRYGGRSAAMRQLRVVLLVGSAISNFGVGAHINDQSSTSTRFLQAPELAAHDAATYSNGYEDRGVTNSGVEMLKIALKSIVPESQLEILFKHAASADDVFKILLAHNAADDLLNAWLNYMKHINHANTLKKTSLIATLTAHYGDDGMVKIIEAAKQVPSTATIAKRLESELTQFWLGQKYSVDDVFKLLNLERAGDQLFVKPEVVAWVRYVDDFNELNPDGQVSLFSFLTTFYPKEEMLVSMLIAAKKSPITENIAVRIQGEQTKTWLADKKSPADIFTLLKLKEEGALLSSPLFKSWLKYTDEYNMINWDEKVVSIKTLRKHYSDDVLAKMIVTAGNSPSTENLSRRLRSELLREWYDTLKPGDFVFKALKLERTGLKVFERSLFPLWKQYVEFVSLKDPRIKVNFVSPLIKVYGERKLTRILTAAENVPSTKKFATDLLDALLKRWLSEKRNPKDVFSLLRVEGTAADDASRLLYNKYIEDFKAIL